MYHYHKMVIYTENYPINYCDPNGDQKVGNENSSMAGRGGEARINFSMLIFPNLKLKKLNLQFFAKNSNLMRINKKLLDRERVKIESFKNGKYLEV